MNDVCVLSLEEAGRLENWGIWPTCKAHRHVKNREAQEAAKAGLVRFLGGLGTKILDPVSMVVPVAVQMWQPVACHNVDGSSLHGMRTWGLPSTR